LAFVPDAIAIGLFVGWREGVDVVSAQDPFATGVAGLVVARALGRPLNVQVHFDFAGNPWWARERLEQRLFLPVARSIVQAADTVRTGTTRERDLYVAWRGSVPGIRTGEPADVVVAPVAVGEIFAHASAADAELRSWVRESGGDALVLSMARLVDSKDHDTLLRAMARVVAKRPRARLAIVGDGPRRAELEALARFLGIAGSVRFLGAVPGARGPAVMAAADVYALTSWYEGTSLVTLEAGALGVPVVSTNVAGVDDTIVDGVTGIVVPVGDVAAVAGAVLRLLGDRVGAASMGAAARAHVAEHFARDEAIASLIGLWAATATVVKTVRVADPVRGWGEGQGASAQETRVGPGSVGADLGSSPTPSRWSSDHGPSRGATGRWAYVANARFPSEKAQSFQIAQMIDAWGAAGVSVELIYPARANLDGLDGADPEVWYGLRAPLRRRALPVIDPVKLVTIDIPLLNRAPLPAFAFGMQAASFAVMASLLLSVSRVEVVYGRDWAVLAMASVVARGRPVVWEAHDLPERGASRDLLRRALPRFSAVVAISGGVRDDIVALGMPIGRVMVAHDAVAWDRFADVPNRGSARTALATSHPAVPGLTGGADELVVYTGHLYPWKGAHVLARASLALRARRANAQIAIVGGTPADVSGFRAFVAAERLLGVHVVGHVPPSEIPTWLAAADVLVLPNSATTVIGSRYTSPLKLFEYMASGRPIVASDVPAVREVVTDGETAVLVPPDDPQALGEGIAHVLDVPTLAERIGTNGRAWVRKRTWETRAKAIRTFVDGTLRG
jgi:glycosyltransferase involved in cell wall biosynthesis